jgi:hypothetical protein
MKSGTTYLSELLKMHPDVFVSSPREPCHFVDPAVLRTVWPQMWQRGYWRSVERYLSLFAAAGDARIIAEGSTAYSQAPLFTRVPERILEFSPDAKFIYIMRDPVERTLSHYWHRVRWWGERRQPLSAIRENQLYLSASHYAHQLRAYLQHVPKQRIYVLTFEELIADPLKNVQALYAWLGVEPAFAPVLDYAPTNPTPATVEQVRGFGALNHIRRSAFYARVEPWLPASLRKLARGLAVRDIRPADACVEAVEHYLRPIQTRHTAELSQLLGRGFAEWATLFATASATRAGTLPGSRLPGRERVTPDKPQGSDRKRCVAHHEVCR